MSRLKDLGAVTQMRVGWARDRFTNAGYEQQTALLPRAEALVAELLVSTERPGIIHGDLQAKNILVDADGRWQAIDPFTCRGDVNAEAALWAVLLDDDSSIEDRVKQLSVCPLFDEQRLHAWCQVFTVVEYRSYTLPMAARAVEFLEGPGQY